MTNTIGIVDLSKLSFEEILQNRSLIPNSSNNDINAKMSLKQIVDDILLRSDIKGVFLIPIYVYGNAGSDKALVGKICTFLGKERAGQYAQKYNLFGGKIEPYLSVIENLLKETREEMGFDIRLDQIDRALLGTHMLNKTLLVFVNIVGLRTDYWRGMMRDREKKKVHYDWLEMNDAKHFCITDLQDRSDVSGFAKSVASLFLKQNGRVLRQLSLVKSPLKYGDLKQRRLP